MAQEAVIIALVMGDVLHCGGRGKTKRTKHFIQLSRKGVLNFLLMDGLPILV